jgi:tetratricopeptide (TPR) repeat protein
MAKPMAMTLPCALLLLDVWPLRRWRIGRAFPPEERHNTLRIILEKAPLLAMALLAALAARAAAGAWGTIASAETLSAQQRIANAATGYAAYLGKFFVPLRLAVIYPYVDNIPAWRVILALLVLTILTVACAALFRREPSLTIGWLWYLGTLLPVSGLLVRIGKQSIADRFAYVPFIGIYVMIAWGGRRIMRHAPGSKRVLVALAILWLSALTLRTAHQVGYWKDSRTLFEHTLRVTDNNYLAHYCMGCALRSAGDTDGAVRHLNRALQINPDAVDVLNDLGVTLLNRGQLGPARNHFEAAIRLAPDKPDAYGNLANVMMNAGQYGEAAGRYRDFLARMPAPAPDDYASGVVPKRLCEAHYRLGYALVRTGSREEAASHLRLAVEGNPSHAPAWQELGLLLASGQRFQEALPHLQEAAARMPADPFTHGNLGRILAVLGRYEDAAAQLQHALRLKPDLADATFQLALVSRAAGRPEEARDYAGKALALALQQGNRELAQHVQREFGIDPPPPAGAETP